METAERRQWASQLDRALDRLMLASRDLWGLARSARRGHEHGCPWCGDTLTICERLRQRIAPVVRWLDEVLTRMGHRQAGEAAMVPELSVQRTLPLDDGQRVA